MLSRANANAVAAPIPCGLFVPIIIATLFFNPKSINPFPSPFKSFPYFFKESLNRTLAISSIKNTTCQSCSQIEEFLYFTPTMIYDVNRINRI